MIALLSGRFRLWLFMAIVLPIIGFGARKLSIYLESRRGSSTASRVLRKTADLSERRAAKSSTSSK
jgi:hypothetical protein